jgi:serine/threonine-protein kinase
LAGDHDSPATAQDGANQDPFVGRVFNGRFHVQSLIARGGLGAVYKAEQAPLGRMCAIKILQPRYEETTPDEFNKRFFLEASIASKLTHPNNVTLYDYGHTKDDIYFMAMELLDGQTLAQTIQSDGPMGEERATHIARQICRALREAHSLGVIHRDIKPSNIFLTQKHDEPDFVKVMDFGLVKDVNLQDDGLTKAGMFMGSPKYMSPEQIQGQIVDARSDIYAVGVVIFEMVTGKTPFDRRSSVQTLIAHLNEDAPALRQAYADCVISAHMEQVIYRCMAKSPADRFSSTDELLIALKGFMGAAATATISSVSGSFPSLNSSSSHPHFVPGRSGSHVFMAGQTSSDGITPGAVAAAKNFADRARTRRLLWGGLAAAGVGAAVVAAILLRPAESVVPAPVATLAPSSETPAASVVPAAPASEPVASAPEPTPEAAPPPLLVETTPAGALIRLGDGAGKTLCDSTPCEIPRSELPNGTVELHITKNNYVITTEKAEPGQEKLSVRLIHTGVAAPPKKDEPAAAPPRIYKNDPY